MVIKGMSRPDVLSLVQRVRRDAPGSGAQLALVLDRLARRPGYEVMVAVDRDGLVAARQVLVDAPSSVAIVADEAELYDLVARATVDPSAWALIVVARVDGAGLLLARRMHGRLRRRLDMAVRAMPRRR